MNFTTIKNGVDTRLNIIHHDETGFYNITKTTKLIKEMMTSEADRKSPQPSRGPLVAHWTSNQKTKELFEACAIVLDYEVNDLKFEISNGPNDYRGTYVHPDLYDHFVAWIDPKYALLISNILKQFHKEANRKIIQEKDDKIDECIKKIDQQSQKIDQQSEQIAELLGYAKDTTQTLHEVQDDLTETKETVKIAKEYLQEKSFTSTKNPSDKNKHHYFAATTYLDDSRNQVVKFVSGQKCYVDKTIAKYVEQHNHKIIIKPFFNANGIDLRHNVNEEFMIRRAERVKEINVANDNKDREFNKQLLREINRFNKLNPDNKRSYISEKRKTPTVKAKNILVKFSKLSFVYTINPHLGFNEVLQIIIDVNNITQDSPMNSSDEE